MEKINVQGCKFGTLDYLISHQHKSKSWPTIADAMSSMISQAQLAHTTYSMIMSQAHALSS